jgi:NitT/TauT family transport system substrate-binding protein
VAEAKGFWRELGVNVEVVTMESNIQMNEALMAGEVTIQFDMLGTAIGLYEEGKPIVIIAETDWSHGGDKIIVKKDLHLNAYKGKTVGVYINKPSLRFFLNFFLSAQEMQVADFQLWEAPPETLVSKFIDNDLQMILAYDRSPLSLSNAVRGRLLPPARTIPGLFPKVC